MKTLTKTMSITLEAIAIIGIVAGLFFAFQFAKSNLLPSNESGGQSLAIYPLPESTQVDAPFSAPTPIPTPDILANGWYIYNDPDREFSFAYPPTALIDAGQNPVDLSKNIDIQFRIPDKPYQGMSIRLEPNPKRLQGVDIAKNLFEKSAQMQASPEFTDSLMPISVGGLSAIQASFPSTNTEITVIVAYDDKVLILAPVHDSAETKVEKEVLELFYQILGTFKFTTSD